METRDSKDNWSIILLCKKGKGFHNAKGKNIQKSTQKSIQQQNTMCAWNKTRFTQS